MRLQFQAVTPSDTKYRLKIPQDVIDSISIYPRGSVDAYVNGKKYKCKVFSTGREYYISFTTANKKSIGFNRELDILLEYSDIVYPDIHAEVLNWETTACVELMQKVGIRENNTVVDFGCGFGHYTLACGLCMNNTGKVYAVDMSYPGLRWIQSKANMYHVTNIQTIKTNGVLAMPFEDESIDFVIMYDFIHLGNSLEEKGKAVPIRFPFYKEAHRVLKKGGILSVLTFDSELGVVPDETNTRREYTYKEMLDEIPPYGFEHSHVISNGVHFDWYHSSHRVANGFFFNELETNDIYNFCKI